MKLEAEIAKIIKSADGVRKIAEIIRGQQKEVVEANAMLEAVVYQLKQLQEQK